MEMGMMEVEDDVFFADLNRQISLLITDDEDDDGYYYSPPISSYATPVSFQAFSRTSIYPSTQPPQYQQFDQTRSYKTGGSEQSKGTGVFIPAKSTSQWSRRRNKHQNKTTTDKNNSYNSYNNNNNCKSYRQQLPSQAVFAKVRNAS